MMLIPSISISFCFFSGLGGLGCCASASSFALRRSLRAISTGPNTLFFSPVLFFLIELALALFAIVSCMRMWGYKLCGSVMIFSWCLE